MANKNLEYLLNEYEQKRVYAERKLDARKEKLYNDFPRIKYIDDTLNKISIAKMKATLFKPDVVQNFDEELNDLRDEKREIYEKEDINKRYFSDIFECNICKDIGYIQNEDGKTVMCSCLKQRLLDASYNLSNLSDIKRENFENFNVLLFSDEVNEKKYNSKGSPRQNIIAIKNACMKFVQNFEDLEQKNLLFIGHTGLGKTYMSNCVANEILKKRENGSLSDCSSFA